MLLCGFIFLVFGSMASANAQSWMDPSWNYRSQVNISNPGGFSLTNFQVKVSLNSNFDFTKALTNGADLRVTASDGATQIPFWIESYSPSSSTGSIWVRVPSIPAAGTVIYLYYGNPAASTASNGTATFEFFDDFENVGPTSQLGYMQLSAPVNPVPLTQSQSWESDPPHTFSIVEANSAGYRYWGYYGLAGGCGGVGLAFSNDLTNWTKYSGNPVFLNGRWPSVLLVNGTYYMAYDKDYCNTSYVVLATSTDGINFTDAATLVPPETGWRNQNPHLWLNPNDGQFYLYYYRGNDNDNFDIRVRKASTIQGLSTASYSLLVHTTISLAAPNMLYDHGTYYLSTESRNPVTTHWETYVYSSSTPDSGFQLMTTNPVLSPGACMFQHPFGTTLHNYYCDFQNGVWTLQHRAADLTATRKQYYPVDSTKWTIVGPGAWAVTSDVQQDGTTGYVAEGMTTFARQMIRSNGYNGTDYVVEAYGKQLGGRVWGLGARVTDLAHMYSADMYDDIPTQANLWAYSWNGSSSNAGPLGSAAVGAVNAGSWYKLSIKVHGTGIDVYKDGALQIQSSDSSFSSGGVGISGEAGSLVHINNVLVRKYAAADPSAAITPGITQSSMSIVVVPTSIASGGSATGTVGLALNAPAGGAVVTLASDAPGVASVPVSVTVAAGTKTATFPITGGSVTTASTASISATYNSTTVSTNIQVSPLLSTFSITPPSVLGGNTATGTIGLAFPAPSGGVTVNIATDNPAAVVPTSVFIPAGATSGAFGLSTTPVAATTTATVTASYGGASLQASLTVSRGLYSLAFSPTTIINGQTAIGTVTLGGPAPAGGATVTLSSNNASALTLPSTVTVGAGSTSAAFNATANGVSSDTTVNVTASYNGDQLGSSITISSSGGSWFSPAWLYRSTVTLGNNSGSTLTQFQVAVNLDGSFNFSQARSDGADLRFTDIDGVTTLPYWIESWNPTAQTARIWVRVPSISTSGGVIYMYYGNASASSAANGDATFEFFDDFSTSPLNTTKWTQGAGTWTVINDTQPSGATGGVVQGQTTARQTIISSYTGTDYIVEGNVKQIAGRVLAIGTRATNNSNLYSVNLYEDLDTSNNLYVYSWVNNGGSGASGVLGSAAVGTVTLNTWSKMMIRVHGTAMDIYKDGIFRLTTNDANLATGGIALYGENNTIANFDNIFVRKYAIADPTATVNNGGQQPTATVGLNPATVQGGTTAQGTVTLSAAAPAGGTLVTLSSSNTTVAAVPANITIAAGQQTGTFNVTTNAVATQTSVTIGATVNSVQTTATLTVTSAPPTVTSVSLNPATVVGGVSSTGTVTLSGAALTGGALVTLSSSDTTSAQVPAGVTVAAGATSATFTVTTSAVAAQATPTISASYNNSTQGAVLTVNTQPPITVNSVSLNPASVTGGASSTATVTLGSAAPSGGTVVSVSSNNVAAQVPANVTVTAGATSATFTVTTSAVATQTLPVITATVNASSSSATLTVNPPAVSSVVLNPTAVNGGASSTATVTLGSAAPSGGLALTLGSSNTAAAQVPASVTVAAGATTATFTVTTTAVSATTTSSISASSNGSTASATLTVNPPALTGLSLSPTTVSGGTSSTGTVTLGSIAPAGGTTITLSSGNTAVAQVPATVTVAAGASTATFTVTTSVVGSNSSAVISATLGTTTRTATLTVNAAALSSVSLSPTTVVGGVSSTGTVTLNSAAPASGAVVTLTSSITTAAQVPVSVTVAAGATTARFTITTTPVAAQTRPVISAVYAGVTRTATLTVNPPALSTLALSPTSLVGASNSTGTVTLSGAAPAGGMVVTLTSGNTAVAQVPANVTVAAGATTATFTITTTPVASATTSSISATLGTVTRSVTLTVNPPTLTTLSLNPTTVRGGTPSTGTVTINGPAPAAGAVVTLASNNTSRATVPASVTIPAGSTSASFTVTTYPQTVNRNVTISGTYRTTTRSATLTVTP